MKKEDDWLRFWQGLIIAMPLGIIGWIIILFIISWLSSCMRTDHERKEFHDNGELKSSHRTSSTSWATDSSSRSITIDPNGLVKIEGYQKKEDSISLKYNDITHQWELNTTE